MDASFEAQFRTRTPASLVMFERASRCLPGGVAGSGLGLALVRSIVIRHGGQVTLRSRPEQGTLFTLRLPVGEVTKR